MSISYISYILRVWRCTRSRAEPSPRLPRYTNRHPQCGSRSSVSCILGASPSKPFLMSVWPLPATRAPRRGQRSSLFQHRDCPLPPGSIHRAVDPQATPVGQLDLDYSIATSGVADESGKASKAMSTKAGLFAAAPVLRRSPFANGTAGSALCCGCVQLPTPTPCRSTLRYDRLLLLTRPTTTRVNHDHELLRL